MLTKLKTGFRKAGKAALIVEAGCLAVLLGSQVAWGFSEEGQCVARQEAIFLRNEYELVPDRARDGAKFWCKQHGNMPQGGPAVERARVDGRY